jgi:hypothetical protein
MGAMNQEDRQFLHDQNPDDPDTKREQTCYEKAHAHGEATFTLRAQDITADLVLDFWISAQLEVRQAMDDGLTLVEAIAHVRTVYQIARWSFFIGEQAAPKLQGAARIGKAMAQWPNRKLVD